MKKITLAFLTLLAFQFGNAQQTISFEASEGYTNGDINGQNGWVTTGDGSGGFVFNQVVSSDYATDGTNSFKIAQDDRFGWQENSPIVGGFYNYTTPVPFATAVFSGDIYIDDVIGNASDYRFGTVSLTAQFFTSILEIGFDGSFAVLANGAFVDLVGVTWTPQTWFNVRIEFTATTLTYFINDVQVNQAALGTNQLHAIEQVRFTHDNYSASGFGYLDNFRTNNEPTASVNEFNSNNFSHSYNKDSDVLTIESSTLTFNNIQVYNLLGQEVVNKNLSQTTESINLSGLQDGVYLAKVMIEGQVKTLKFLKN